MSTRNGGNARWKRQEQSIADALSTSLVPNNGVRRSDMQAGQYGVEVKTMKAIPARVRKAMEQSVEACEKVNNPGRRSYSHLTRLRGKTMMK